MAQKSVAEYVSKVEEKYKTGQAREHAYRPAFEALVHDLEPSLKILNDPSRSEHGNPDFVFLRGDVTAGYAETKDINIDLDKTEKSEQMERYLGYSNLILTDYLEFRFFRNGSRYGEPIRIAAIEGGKVVANPGRFDELADAITDFLSGKPEPIKSGKRLAEIMGGKARRIRDNVRRFLTDKADTDTDLLRIYESVKQMLVHDLTLEAFADMYAQTLVYGLFVARYHDESADTFSRAEARDLVPESNPFLRQFFNHIAGPDFNKRLRYIVDELCTVFAAANVRELMEEYFKKNGAAEGQDPVIHFYEDFLKEYDAGLRKKMGAYYTPLPVVRFIVRAVDDVLKKEFGLEDGLADTTKLPDGRHKVQVLDPAVGTGTFISAVIHNIYERFVKQGQKGRWPTYVHHDLLPRIHGFELMMAAYTIAHLKLSIAFKQTGFTIFNKRLGIYLTNSLEQAEQQPDMLSLGFAQSIAEEAKQAAVIKNDMPIMVVLGNPPYSASSSNKGEWIMNLISEYKKNIDEQNQNSLSDDYVKFIRFAEHFIEKNGTGIVAMITNNSYVDGVTHRQMREHLLSTFNQIYILDLHGDGKEKQNSTAEKDENVFNIQQGVSIGIFVRSTKSRKELGTIKHMELRGKRQYKFDFLGTLSLDDKKWQELSYAEPYYFFVPKDFTGAAEYDSGMKLSDLFTKFSSGTKFRKDNLLVKNHFSAESVKEMLNDIHQLSNTALLQKYSFKETADWKIDEKRDLFIPDDDKNIVKVLYRPFDFRWAYYPLDKISQIIPRGDSRVSLMKNMLSMENIGLITNRQIVNDEWSHAGVTKNINSQGTFYLGNKGQDYLMPLYVYAEDGSRILNLNRNIVKKIAEAISFEPKPEEVFDYVYAVLHSPTYREKYQEFLEIDFPRVPYPKGKKQFAALAALGKELRELHLLESPKARKFITTYSEGGSDVMEKIVRKGDSVYINAEQYFGGVPEIAWSFYIGGYQPAQKWLKDRKGRELTNEEIEHYQRMIVALVETDRIMQEIDKVINF